MDPRLAKGLIALAAIVAYVVGAYSADAELSSQAVAFAAAMFGWLMRRPGDEVKTPPNGGSFPW